MSSIIGSICISFIFLGDLPENGRFGWFMGALALSTMISFPCLATISILSGPLAAYLSTRIRHQKNLVLMGVGGILGVISVIGGFALRRTNPLSPLFLSDFETSILYGKIFLAGFCYGSFEGLFLGLHQRPPDP